MGLRIRPRTRKTEWLDGGRLVPEEWLEMTRSGAQRKKDLLSLPRDLRGGRSLRLGVEAGWPNRNV